MLDKQTRGAILLLRRKRHSLRRISRLLSLSRDSVRKVVKAASDEPPIILRPRKLDAHRERITQMLVEFGGNLVRVHRASFSLAIRFATWTRKPSFPTEQNASLKSSILSQPPLALTAQIGRSQHSLKPGRAGLEGGRPRERDRRGPAFGRRPGAGRTARTACRIARSECSVLLRITWRRRSQQLAPGGRSFEEVIQSGGRDGRRVGARYQSSSETRGAEVQIPLRDHSKSAVPVEKMRKVLLLLS